MLGTFPIAIFTKSLVQEKPMRDDYHIVQSAQRELLSDEVTFQPDAGDLLDRLDIITELIEIWESDSPFSETVYGLILSGLSKLKELSDQLKDLILGISSENKELQLLQQMLLQQDRFTILNEFPYVIAYEWVAYCYNVETSCLEQHKGDLILMDDTYNFLILELKYIKKPRDHWTRSICRRKIQTVCGQARKFAEFFRERFPWADVDSLALTNRGIYRSKKKPLQTINLVLPT